MKTKVIVLTPEQVCIKLRNYLPIGWFPKNAPILNAMLMGMSTILATLTKLLHFVLLQTRLSTTTGGFLDLWARDFLGNSLIRNKGESDDSFRARIKFWITQEFATRNGMQGVSNNICNGEAVLVETRNAQDCLAWGVGSWSNPNYRTCMKWGDRGLNNALYVSLASSDNAPNDTVLSVMKNTSASGVLACVRNMKELING